MLLPVLPVVLAVVLLQWLQMPWPALPQEAVAPEAVAALRHGSARLLFAAAVAIHTVVCMGAVVYFASTIVRFGGATTHASDASGSGARAIGVMVVAVSGGVIGAMAALGFIDPPLGVYRYTYFSIEGLLRLSPVSRDLIDGAGLPALALAVLYPSALGVIAVVMASGAACAVLRRIGATCETSPTSEPDAWTERFVRHGRVLLHCFYVLSAVLVTSAIAALLFFHLPVGLLSTAPEHQAIVNAVSAHASGLATFWGMIYTLTLFAVFVGPLGVIYARTHEILEGQAAGTTLAAWLKDRGFGVSLGGGLKNLFVLIAPLLVGPFGELLKLLGR